MRDFISDHLKTLPPSPIRRFFDIASTMDNVISLGIGEPDFVTPGPILQAGIDSLHEGATSYTSNAGILELRQLLAAHLERLYGLHYNPQTELLITVGVSEALYLALSAILNPGEEVIVPEPCFVANNAGVHLAHGVPVSIPTSVEHNFQVTAEAVEAAITPRTKALLVNYPNNPTGAVLTREMMEQIAAVAEKHDILVISDEIYDQLVYGVEHVSFASLPGMHQRTITLGGFSKDYAMTGWRIGYAAAPEPLLKVMGKIHQYLIMSASTTGQMAAIEALRNGAPHVEAMRSEYDRRRRLIVEGLNALGLTCFEPRGAFYAFPKVAHTGMDDVTFAERLLAEERVAVVPGSAFGPSGAGYVRCSYATAYEQIEEALARMERFVHRHAAPAGMAAMG